MINELMKDCFTAPAGNYMFKVTNRNTRTRYKYVQS